MGFKKNIKKLFREPTEMKIEEIINILENFNYRLARIHGSHYVFSKHGYDTITVPVHRKKVRKVYLTTIREIVKELLMQ